MILHLSYSAQLRSIGVRVPPIRTGELHPVFPPGKAGCNTAYAPDFRQMALGIFRPLLMTQEVKLLQAAPWGPHP
jgi:hypothetical protein